MKFTYKLLFFWLVLIILPVFLFGFSVFQRDMKAEKKAVYTGRLLEVRSLADEIGDRFQEVQNGFSALEELHPHVSEELLVSALKRISVVKSLVLLDPTGKPQIVVPATSKLKKMDNARALYFTEPLASGTVYLSGFIGDSTAFMSLPIRSAAGSVRAVLVGEIDLSFINQRLSAQSGSIEKSLIYIVDKHGQIFPPALSQQSDGASSPVVSRIRSDSAEWAGPYHRGRVQMFVAYAPVPATTWWVVIEQPYAQAFSSVLSLEHAGLEILIFSVIGIVFVGFLGSILFARPVNKLRQATTQLASGNYEARVTIKTRDEFEQLGNVFNRMAERVKAYFSISRVLTHFLDVESLSKNVVTIIQGMTHYRSVALYLNKFETGELIHVARQSETASGESAAFNDELRKTCMTSGKPYRSNEGVLLPITGNEKVYGLLEIVNHSRGIIDEETIQGLEQVSQHVAIALANAELYSQETKRAAEQATLYNVAHIASQSLKLEELLSRVLDQVLAATKHDIGGIYLWDEVEHEMVLKQQKGLPSDFVSQKSRWKPGSSKDSPFRTGRVYVVEDLEKDALITPNEMNALKIRSGVFVPLKAKGEIIGAMQLATYRVRRFEPGDVALLTAVGEEIGIAISNAKLFSDISQRFNELQSIQELGTRLGGELKETRVIKLVTTQARRLSGATSAWINLVSVDGKYRVHRGCVGQGATKMEGTEIEIKDALQDLVIKNGEPIISNEVQKDSRALNTIVDDLDIRNAIIVPLRVKDQIIGCLTVFNQKLHRPFTSEHLRLLTIFANQAVVAIENARLHSARRRQVEEKTIVSDIMRSLANNLDLERAFQTVVEGLRTLTGCERVSLAIIDKTLEHFTMVALDQPRPELNKGTTLPLSATASAGDLLAGHPHLTPDLDTEVDYPGERALYDAGFRSRINLPLMVGEQVIGALNLASRQRAGFTEVDLPVLQQIADVLAIAIENSRLFATEKKRTQQLEAIHKVGERITAIVDLDDLFRTVVAMIKDIFSYDTNYIVLVEGNEFVVKSGTRLGQQSVANFRMPLSQRSLTGLVITSGKPLISNDLEKEPKFFRIEEVKDLKSMLLAPIKVSKGVIGALGIGDPTANAFDEIDLVTFENLAGQIGIAIQNAQLFATEKKRARQLEAIHKVGEKITAVVDLNKLYETIVETIKNIFGYESIHIVQIEGNEVVARAGVKRSKKILKNFRLPLTQRSLTATVVSTGRPVIANDVDKEPGYYRFEEIKDLKSMLMVPIKVNERVTGVLGIGELTVNAFDETDRITFENLAEQIGIAIQNAQLFAQEEKRLKQLEAIRKVNEEITAILDLERLFPAIADTLKETFGLYHTYILLVEGNDLVMRAVSGTIYKELVGKFRIAIGENSINSWVTRTGKPLMVNDVSKEPRYYHLEETKETRAELAVPIKQKGRVIGTIGVIDIHPNAFDETDLQTFQNLATQIGIAIENARLYEQTVMLKKLTDAVIENLTSGVMYVDTEGKVLICNRSMAELLGVGATELVGKSPRMLSEAFETSSCPFQQVLKSGKSLVYHETKFKKTDGSYLTVGMSITPLTDAGKKTIGAVGLFVDLTPLKTMEAEQRHVRDLALLGGTVTRLAHEIKNPLAAILSGIQLLERRLEPKKEQRVHFDAIVTEIQRLDSCLKELLVFSKPKEPEFSNENPLLPLENALKLLEPQLTEHQIRLVRDFEPALPHYRMDPQKMVQVFLNLMLNAIQASPPGGSIRVSVRSVISSPLQANDGFSILRYEITDFGSGISKENLEKIFDPFFSTKTQGIGLGLTIVRRIVEEHGGTITVKSKPGQETTFIVRLITEKV